MVDASLIEQVKAGNLNAFEKLVHDTQKKGFNIAYGILHDSLDAEEVLQEAYIQVYNGIQNLKVAEAFLSWFGKIVTHLAFRKSKEKGRFITLPLDETAQVQADSFSEGPDKLVIKKETANELINALKSLPDEHKATLILREWEDYSYQQIGEVLDIPLGTVKSRIFAARKMLFKQLKGGVGDE